MTADPISRHPACCMADTLQAPLHAVRVTGGARVGRDARAPVTRWLKSENSSVWRCVFTA